jgi:type IV pilus assembly protein PilY1
VQSWYGVIDSGSLVSRSDLVERTIESSDEEAILSDGTIASVRFVEQAVAGDMTGKKGWYIDFNIAKDAGERIVTPSVVFSAGTGASKVVLTVNSLVPSDNKCEGGGRGHANFINAFTGGELEFPIADINGDGKVDNNDLIGERVPASLGFDGIPGAATPLNCDEPGGAILVGSSTGKIADTAFACPSSPGIKGRLSWREIVN